MNDFRGGPHRALGIFFVRDGPAEMGQDAIADIAGDKAVVAGGDVAAEGSIRMQQITQLFRVELFTVRSNRPGRRTSPSTGGVHHLTKPHLLPVSMPGNRPMARLPAGMRCHPVFGDSIQQASAVAN
jgi:hypothetical protein